MLYSQQLWKRFTPKTQHRIELAVIAVLAFISGAAVTFYSSSASNFLTADRPVAPAAISAPMVNKPAVEVGNEAQAAPAVADEQRALELYRQGERDAWAAPAVADEQRALELYRQGERDAWAAPGKEP